MNRFTYQWIVEIIRPFYWHLSQKVISWVENKVSEWKEEH